MPDRIEIMGVHVTPFSSYVEACDHIGYLIQSGGKAFSVAINPEKIYKAVNDEPLKVLLNKADLCICDGIGAALAVRFLSGKSIPRITGISLFFELIRRAHTKGWRIFLLGASPESNLGAVNNLLADYPGLQVVGHVDGFFKDTAEVIRKINASGADIVFVAMGSPKQEVWIDENRNNIDAPFCMGVGGTFDVVSGKAKWAPAICRKTGTEWLYRLVSDPKRWRRQLVLPKFAWAVLKERFVKRAHL